MPGTLAVGVTMAVVKVVPFVAVSVNGRVEFSQTPVLKSMVSCNAYELPDHEILTTPLAVAAASTGSAETAVAFNGAGPVAGEPMLAII